VRNVWVVKIVRIVGVVRMVAGIVRTEAEVAGEAAQVGWTEAALVGAWSLKLIVVELGGGVAPTGRNSHSFPLHKVVMNREKR
jgi:hypothetical protein